MKVFLFSYAGSLGYPYRAWENIPTKDLELVTIEYPGRGKRSQEKFPTNWNNLIEDVAKSVLSNVQNDESFFIFGHSMGAKVAYDVTNYLQKENQQLPLVVFISGSLPFNKKENLYLDNDEMFREQMINLGGIPQEVLDDSDLSDYVFGIMKEDVCLLNEFSFDDKLEMPTKVVIFEGKNDFFGNKEDWNMIFEDQYDFKLFPGGHFFVFESSQDVISEIESYVSYKK